MSMGGVSLPVTASAWCCTSLVPSIEAWRLSSPAACSLSNRRATSPDRSESLLCAEKKPLCGDPSALLDFPFEPPSICDSGELTAMVSPPSKPTNRGLRASSGALMLGTGSNPTTRT
jgi:hypothetical protein